MLASLNQIRRGKQNTVRKVLTFNFKVRAAVDKMKGSQERNNLQLLLKMF